MATMNRTAANRPPKKRTTSKKRSVRFTGEEIRILASDLQRSFFMCFVEGIGMNFITAKTI